MRYMSLGLMALLAACSAEGPELAGADRDPGHEAVHWGYAGDAGPERWADISPDFALCGEGQSQSPIDLSNAELTTEKPLDRTFGKAVLTATQRATVMDIIDNGHTIQITNNVALTAELDGKSYELVQYHFHAPSEHTIDGQHSPLEAHLVHKAADGELAVFGVLVEEGAHDPLWDIVLSALPDDPDDPRHLENLDLDVSDLKPLPKHYYRYEGSLTTPPCSEGVQWVVSAVKREISPEQMAEITSHLRNNYRPVQPLGDRRLMLVSETSTSEQ